ncbi:MAG TPA: hypothetical protein VGE50_02930 [Gammaproteobacteria bacterium]
MKMHALVNTAVLPLPLPDYAGHSCLKISYPFAQFAALLEWLFDIAPRRPPVTAWL